MSGFKISLLTQSMNTGWQDSQSAKNPLKLTDSSKKWEARYTVADIKR
jgi:hypothetical protein